MTTPTPPLSRTTALFRISGYIPRGQGNDDNSLEAESKEGFIELDESPSKLKPNFNNKLNAFKPPTEVKLVSNRITIKSDNDKQQAFLGINTKDKPKLETNVETKNGIISKLKPITIQSSIYIKGNFIFTLLY